MERPVSPREGAGAASEQDELPPSSNLAGQKCGHWAGGPEALKPGPGGERPSSYGACSRRPSQRCRLSDHTHVHRAEQPCRCAECGRAFRQRGRLRLHRQPPSHEPPCTGPECGLGFRLRSALRAHGLRHGGAACSFPGENARSWEALGEARPGQSSLSAGALRSRASATRTARSSPTSFLHLGVRLPPSPCCCQG